MDFSLMNMFAHYERDGSEPPAPDPAIASEIAELQASGDSAHAGGELEESITCYEAALAASRARPITDSFKEEWSRQQHEEQGTLFLRLAQVQLELFKRDRIANLGSLAEAEKCALFAKSMGPGCNIDKPYWIAQELLGDIYLLVGKFTDAAKEYADAKESCPDAAKAALKLKQDDCAAYSQAERPARLSAPVSDVTSLNDAEAKHGSTSNKKGKQHKKVPCFACHRTLQDRGVYCSCRRHKFCSLECARRGSEAHSESMCDKSYRDDEYETIKSNLMRRDHRYHQQNWSQSDMGMVPLWNAKGAADSGDPCGLFTVALLEINKRREQKQFCTPKAIDLLQQAANQGHCGAMVSLADKLVHGEGIEQDTRRALDMLYDAFFCTTAEVQLFWKEDAERNLCNQGMLHNEIIAFGDMIEMMDPAIRARVLSPFGPALTSGGPNLASLIYAVAPHQERQKLAGRRGPLRWLAMAMSQSMGRMQNAKITWRYCHAGVAKQATALCTPNASKQSEFTNMCLQTPSKRHCEALIERDSPLRKGLQIVCIHTESKTDYMDGVAMCTECRQDAQARLVAVRHSAFALSARQTLRGYGHSACYAVWSHKPETRMERFKSYSKCEVAAVLGVLLDLRPDLLVPGFLASDPNLYWPIVYHFGSVAGALLDMNIELESSSVEETAVPAWLSKAFPGGDALKCGADECIALDWNMQFRKCGQCRRIKYCSHQCQKGHWKVHKLACIRNVGSDNAAGTGTSVDSPPNSANPGTEGLQSVDDLVSFIEGGTTEKASKDARNVPRKNRKK